MLTKKAQAGRYSKKDGLRIVNQPEAVLQDFTNNHLKWSNVGYWRVPDNAKISALAGFPDNLCLIPISDRFSLAMSLELKTRSKLRQCQRKAKEKFAHQIAQTPEEVEFAVWEFRKAAEKLKKYLEKEEK